jgi:hypothetical protein
MTENITDKIDNLLKNNTEKQAIEKQAYKIIDTNNLISLKIILENDKITGIDDPFNGIVQLNSFGRGWIMNDLNDNSKWLSLYKFILDKLEVKDLNSVTSNKNDNINLFNYTYNNKEYNYIIVKEVWI